MFEPTPQSGEQQPQSTEPSREAAPAQPATPAQSGASGAEKPQEFEKAVDEKTQAYEKKVEELEKKYKTRWSIGETKEMLITARQKNALRLAAAEKKEQFGKLAAEEKSKRMALMLGETEQALSDVYLPYEKIIDHVRGLDKLDEKELVQLEALLKALNKMKTNPEMEKLFLKVLNKEQLDPKEMQFLVTQIKPVDLNQAIEKGQTEEIFEASAVGAVISCLQENQKPQLVEMIIAQKPQQEWEKILDVFITTGQLSNLQLQNMLSLHKIPEPAAGRYKAELEKGELTKKQQEYQKKIDTLQTVNQGRTPENALSKTVGGPAAFGLMSVWGAAIALVNFKLSMDWSNPGQGIANVLSNEYFLMGTAMAAGGAAGTLSIVAPDAYAKIKDQVGDFFSGPAEKKNKEAIQKTQVMAVIENQLKRNPFLMNFLAETEEFPGGTKKSGMDLLKELAGEQRAQNKTVSMDFQDILAKCGPHQKELLTRAYGLEGDVDVNLKDSLHTTMGALTYLKMDNAAALNKIITDLNNKQGIA